MSQTLVVAILTPVLICSHVFSSVLMCSHLFAQFTMRHEPQTNMNDLLLEKKLVVNVQCIFKMTHLECKQACYSGRCRMNDMTHLYCENIHKNFFKNFQNN